MARDLVSRAADAPTNAQRQDVVLGEVCRLAGQMVPTASATIGLRPDVGSAAGLSPDSADDAIRIAGLSGRYLVVAESLHGRPERPQPEWTPVRRETVRARTARGGLSSRTMPVTVGTDAAAGVLHLVGPAVHLSELDAYRQLESLAAIAGAHLDVLVARQKTLGQAKFYHHLIENSTDTLVRGDLDGVRLYVSPSVRHLLGYEPHELIGRRAAEIVHPEDAAALRTLLFELREGRLYEGVTEHRQRHKDGSWVWLEALIKRTLDERTGALDGYVVSVRDISKRKCAELRLKHLASHDALTDLPNRSLVNTWIRRNSSPDAPAGSSFAVLYLDLDHFKPVNDTLGHEAGDFVLQTIAARFRKALRRDDLIARLGGDEFVVVTGDITPAGAAALSDRLIATAAEPIAVRDTDVRIGLSIGVAIVQDASRDADALLNAADRALYRAKAAGRNGYHIAYVQAGTRGSADEGPLGALSAEAAAGPAPSPGHGVRYVDAVARREREDVATSGSCRENPVSVQA